VASRGLITGARSAASTTVGGVLIFDCILLSVVIAHLLDMASMA